MPGPKGPGLTMTARLFAFALLLGGLRDPKWFAVAGAAVWAAVWLESPALGPAARWLPWLTWAALSALASSQPLAALPVLARWSAVLACASLAGAWKREQREEWLKAFLVAACGVAVAALATGAGRGWRNAMTGVIPPYSNYSAFVLGAAGAAAWAWILHPRGPKGVLRAAAGAAALMSLTAVLLASSRGAWLGRAAAAAVWSARRWGARAAAGFSVAGAVFLAAHSAGFLPGPVENALLKKYRLHAEARPRLWHAAEAVADDAPWLGTGPGNLASGFRRHPVAFEDGAARWAMSTDYAHSEVLQVAAETGWPGLALWLLAAFFALRALASRAGDDPVREAAAAATAAMSAHLLVDDMLQLPALAALWLTAMTLAAAPHHGKTRWPRAAALAGALLALVSWIPRAAADASPARAAVLFPADPSPREDLGYAAAAAGDAAGSDAHWAAAQRLAPFNAIYPWRRGQIAGTRGDWAAAEGFAARAAELEPGFIRARLLRVEALARLKRTREARAELDELSRIVALRAGVPLHSGYERVVWEFDRAEYDRAAASLKR